VILDTSALLAVLFDEEDARQFAELIREAQSCRISAATFVELCMVLESASGAVGIVQCDMFIRGNSIVIEPFTELHAYTARQAFSDYGKGRHRAGLNFGDCFSYALAKVSGEPLLFKGKDFSKTDIIAAKA
jgi:ribonuclease VapC